jgi:hypothetical protein
LKEEHTVGVGQVGPEVDDEQGEAEYSHDEAS